MWCVVGFGIVLTMPSSSSLRGQNLPFPMLSTMAYNMLRLLSNLWFQSCTFPFPPIVPYHHWESGVSSLEKLELQMSVDQFESIFGWIKRQWTCSFFAAQPHSRVTVIELPQKFLSIKTEQPRRDNRDPQSTTLLFENCLEKLNIY